MSESTSTTTTTAPAPAGEAITATTATSPATSESAEGGDDWKGRAREWERRANADKTAREKAEAELEKVRQQGLSESEKALAKARKEAMEEGRSAAMSEVGKELVSAELRAVLKGRHDDPDAVIDALDPSRFLKDGRADRVAIQAWADKAHPERPGGPADLGLGRRQSAPVNDMNTAIRRAAGHQV